MTLGVWKDGWLVVVLKPSFKEEKLLWTQGYQFIAGIDEVGRGCLAGPVVAAAVVLPPNLRSRWVSQVRDSKLLTAAKREELSAKIKEAAIAFGIGSSSNEVIERRGIVKATRLAMKDAVSQISPTPEYLLIDFFKLPEVELPQQGVPEGDGLCFSIAAASIVAKVARDQMMVELDAKYPGYGLAEHKGYGTAEHLACLRRLGPCAIHRRTFQPIRDVTERLF